MYWHNDRSCWLCHRNDISGRNTVEARLWKLMKSSTKLGYNTREMTFMAWWKSAWLAGRLTEIWRPVTVLVTEKKPYFGNKNSAQTNESDQWRKRCSHRNKRVEGAANDGQESMVAHVVSDHLGSHKPVMRRNKYCLSQKCMSSCFAAVRGNRLARFELGCKSTIYVTGFTFVAFR